MKKRTKKLLFLGRTGPRAVIVHYHIFKNAGTSVDAVLKTSFGTHWATFEGQHASDVQKAEALRAFLHAHPDIEAVSTHLGRPPLPWAACLPIVFLRHPILRARSVYEFTRQDPNQPFSEIAKTEGFGGYVRWALEGNGNGIVIRNYQVVHLSDASFRTPDIYAAKATQDDVRQSRDLLAHWGMCGIAEAFETSATKYQARYAAAKPAFSFEPLWLNRTRQAAGTVEQELAGIRSLLGAALYNRLVENNELDLNLYQFACTLLDRA